MNQLKRPVYLNNASRGDFRERLLAWYDCHKRDLPWRATRDPYRIWISEIMLQQTRVAAVVEYYARFLKRFPTVNKLASAPRSSVLAAWSGLGYYRRARMLHEAARKVVNELGGRFPQNVEELRTLPGVGRYTAAAIASIAFAAPVAVVDGNVERVLQRVRGGKLAASELWASAQELLARARPADFNQAMMELGATVCLPRQPRCLLCPVCELCATRGPLDSAKPETRQRREIHYALACRKAAVFLVQRPRRASLMAGMWELPEIPAKNGHAGASIKLKHSITVTDYIVHVATQHEAPTGTDGKWVASSKVARLPLTGLTRKILLAAKII